MTATQVTAATALLRKTLPDLSAMAHSGTLEVTRPDELSDAELANIASAGSTRASDAESGEALDGELH